MINPFKKLLNINIRNKLFLMFIVVIVPMFAAGVYLILSMIGILRAKVVDEAFTEAENLKTRLRDTIYTTTGAADRIYVNENINDFLNAHFADRNLYLEFYATDPTIKEYLSAYSQIEDIIFYVDIDNFVYNSHFRQITSDVRSSYWYRDAMESNAPCWQVIKNPSDDNLYLSYLRQICDKNGDYIGIMVVSVSNDWIEGLMKDEPNSVMFSVQNGLVFYSNIESFELGKVFTVSEASPSAGQNGSCEIDSRNVLTELGYTVMNYFDYENTGNLFQIYLVKPYSLVSGSTQSLTVTYVWYVLLCFLLSILITYLFSTWFARRINLLRDQMHKVAVGDFNFEAEERGGDEINDLYADLQLMVTSMQQLINEAYEAKIQSETFKLNQMEAEFKTLASQINPHFLYNTLETIRMKAYCNNDKETADLVKKLGKFMRRCLEVKNGLVTLESELEFTQSYLELQAARFGDRVSYNIYCEVDKEYKILPLIIQPIVENAFVHGIESSKSNGRIDIKICYRSDLVVIDVIDNGQGIPDDKMSELRWKLMENDTSSGKSIGLTNVNKRIKMYHGDKYGLSVSSKVGKGTRIRISLPRNFDETIMSRRELIAESTAVKSGAEQKGSR